MKKILFRLMALTIAVTTFTACEDVPEPYPMPGTEEEGGTETPTITPTGTGTLADPFNVAAAIEKCKEIGDVESTEMFYVKGIVDATTAADDSYGNATFDIVDAEGGDKFKCFQVAGTDGKKLPKGFIVNQGDEIVVYGPIYNYRGNTPETAGKGTAYIVTVNGKSTEGGTPTDIATVGSIDNPQTVAQALTVIDALDNDGVTAELYYVKGKIKAIKTSAANITQYKNIDYIITDDGKNELTVFRGKNLDNTDFTNDIFHIADLGFTELSMEPVVCPPDDPCALTYDDLPVLFEQYEILAKDMLRREKEGKPITFYHYMLDLSSGPCIYKRISGCGSGTEYMAVTPWGDPSATRTISWATSMTESQTPRYRMSSSCATPTPAPTAGTAGLSCTARAAAPPTPTTRQAR